MQVRKREDGALRKLAGQVLVPPSGCRGAAGLVPMVPEIV